MTDREIEALLADEVVARVACHADGEIYVVPVALVWHGSALWGFSHDGRKIAMMRRNPEVCVEIDRVRHLGSWESVVAWGSFEELANDEADRGAAIVGERLATLAADRESRRRLEEALAGEPAPIVYRIVVRKMTGRIEESE